MLINQARHMSLSLVEGGLYKSGRHRHFSMNNVIDFLVFYFPKKSNLFDDVSQLVLNFKDGHPAAIRYFHPKVVHWISCFISYRPVYLCAVPSSRVGAINTISGLAALIADDVPGLHNACGYITAVKPRKSYCMSGVRNPNALISSLAFADDIKGKHFLLLDDVTTTGTSLTAVRNELLFRGALSVRCLAIAQTYSPW